LLRNAEQALLKNHKFPLQGADEFYTILHIPPSIGGILKKAIATAFGNVMRGLRVAKGMTQEEVGLKADLQRKHISLLELGAKAPSLTTAFQIAEALEIEPGELVTLVSKRIQENN
jgi:DNA-binding XRE family transcriptional regulator